MMRFATMFLALSACAVGLLASSPDAAAQAARGHVGHVADKWNDTPDQAGLLPTAAAEAKIAEMHAGLAGGSADNLASIKAHVGHVLHAVDPSVQPTGPGKGYGVLKATKGAATHIRLAASADGASDNVKLHSTHVATSADNVVKWAQRIVELGGQVKAASAAAQAAKLVHEIHELTQAIVGGRDANGDGQTSWGEGEGGLAQAAFHLNLMKKGEGMD